MGPGATNPSHLTVLGNQLIFRGDDGIRGAEIHAIGLEPTIAFAESVYRSDESVEVVLQRRGDLSSVANVTVEITRLDGRQTENVVFGAGAAEATLVLPSQSGVTIALPLIDPQGAVLATRQTAVVNPGTMLGDFNQDGILNCADLNSYDGAFGSQNAILELDRSAGITDGDVEAWLELAADTNLSPGESYSCLLYTSPSPRDATLSRMPSSA